MGAALPLDNLNSGSAQPISRQDMAKMLLKGGVGAAGGGISAAQFLSGAPSLALLVTGAAASATGIGLVISGAVLTVGTMGASAVSAYKTYNHRANLQEIFGRKGCYACRKWPAHGTAGDQKEHMLIADKILPYIISQKGEKLAKKSVAAVGGLAGAGILTSGYGAIRAIYKAAMGTKGVARGENAVALTHHFVTHNCGLAQAIIAELYSFEEMLWLLTQDDDTITPFVMKKMAST